MSEVDQLDTEPLGSDDKRQVKLVAQLQAAENTTVVAFAKQMVTACFSAIAAVVALNEYKSSQSSQLELRLLGVSVALLLIGGIVASLAMVTQRLKVSRDNFSEVDDELRRLATTRFQLSAVALALFSVAVVIAAAVILL
ncbi:hypothetical protein [Gordonia sp. ABSL49_1]|uniref:hypothetical protein n=2 Tax=unclassified Gordonia (in: high G+C Gram-positive bacteria) TaxID=2657482 RepID=UPI001F0FF7C3|nr:hypothetical protein [Gordonia sp. ABSL49_1]MCH5643967.1 hypothetical protein [Gordonia sp. ABSL49_1]